MSTIEPMIAIPDLDPVSGRQATLKRHLIESVVIAAVLTAVSYVVGLRVHWITKLDWLEVVAVATSYSCTWLCVRERRINYPIGAVSSAAYALLFYRADLMSSAVLNAYLVPVLVYGWIRWRRDEDTRPVRRVALKMVPVYLGVTGIAYLGAAYIAGRLHGAMAWTDSAILAGSILAQVLLDNKKLENWIIWGLVNMFAIYTYATSGLPLAALQYVAFFLNCFWGFAAWYGSMRHRDSDRTVAVV